MKASGKPQVLLLGNPNCGKTTLFNELTGTRQHVGNYPGVTVEAKVGEVRTPLGPVELVDLPGVYRLGNDSPEERVVLEQLCRDDIQAIVSVVDSTNLERHLYLTVQLWHFHLPVILVLNMADEAEAHGLSFRIAELEQLLGVRVAVTAASRRRGVAELREMIGRTVFEPEGVPMMKKPSYGEAVDKAISIIAEALNVSGLDRGRLPLSFTAVRVFEGNPGMESFFREQGEEGERFLEIAGDSRDAICREMEVLPSTLLADKRYGIIHGLIREVQEGSDIDGHKATRMADKVLTHRVFGFPVFLLLMMLVFYVSFTVGDPLVGMVEECVGVFGSWVSGWLEGSDFWHSLVVDGMIAGVGGVLSFVPTILILFAFLSLLESTGYMARAAFLMDRFMHRMGLHGGSFIPMLLGFGCNVPAVMATRTIESRTDRLATIFVLPFMSCAARLPVFVLFISALIPHAWQAVTMWSLYVFGVLVAVLCARVLKSSIFKGGNEIFIIELPPYRLPSLKSFLLNLREKASGYVRKAGTFILLGSVVLWFLNTYPKEEQAVPSVATVEAAAAAVPEEVQVSGDAALKSGEFSQSYAARVGRFFEPVTKYAGFDWQANSAMIGAFAAKEMLVAQFGVLFAVEGDEDLQEDESLQQAIASHYSIPQGLSILIFTLLGLPCMATVAVIRKETGSWGFTAAQFTVSTTLAFACSLMLYQAALMNGM